MQTHVFYGPDASSNCVQREECTEMYKFAFKSVRGWWSLFFFFVLLFVFILHSYRSRIPSAFAKCAGILSAGPLHALTLRSGHVRIGEIRQYIRVRNQTIAGRWMSRFLPLLSVCCMRPGEHGRSTALHALPMPLGSELATPDTSAISSLTAAFTFGTAFDNFNVIVSKNSFRNAIRK